MSIWAVVPQGIIGQFRQTDAGWRFTPMNQRASSRKDWPSPAAALPAWCRSAWIVNDRNQVHVASTWGIDNLEVPTWPPRKLL